MSIEEKEPWVWWLDWRVGAAAGVAVIGLVVFAFARLGSTTGEDAQSPNAAGPEENALEQARQLLIEESDLNACRAALQQVNSHLSKPGVRPPAATADQLDAVRGQAGLDAGAAEEVAASTYTLLDGHHLAYCLLMRDVARSLDVRGGARVGGDDRTPLDKATAAFDWVVRQIRPLARRAAEGPPDWVLRRGRGTELDRALAFLGLLPQLNGPDGRPAGLAGALVLCPGSDSKPRLWACAVVLPGGKDLFLFDPRLGLALPGPGGKGVATLAQARQGDVLRQLDAPGGPAYDVTAAQAKAAELQLFCPLSALAPRQRYLQDHMLPPAVEVRLAADLAADLERLKAAAGTGADKPTAVDIWKPGLTCWRKFLGPDEGGVARGEPVPLRNLVGFTELQDETVVKMTPDAYFRYDLVPWPAFPQPFRNNIDMPYNIGLGQKVRGVFMGPWVEAALGSGKQRDLLLRGRFPQAAKQLVDEQEKRRNDQQTAEEAGDLGPSLRAWMDKASRAYAHQLRKLRDGTPAEQEEAAGAVEQLWGDEVRPVYLLLTGAMARPRGAEVTFQLGLCKQEQAERVQARLDLLRRKGGKVPPADLERAKSAWRDALGWWNDYDSHYPASRELAAAGLDRDPVTVRRLRGRAEQALGDTRAALKDWRDVSGPMSDADKVAVLYCARRLTGGQEP